MSSSKIKEEIFVEKRPCFLIMILQINFWLKIKLFCYGKDDKRALSILGSHFNSTGGVEIFPLRRVKSVELNLLQRWS